MKDPYNIKEQIKAYFHFSKSEQRGIIILMVLIVFFLVLPRMYKAFFYKERIVDYTEFETEILAFKKGKQRNLDSVEAAKPDWQQTKKAFPEREKKDNERAYELFSFDPNTVELEELLKLGVKSKTAQTLLRYREKGGKFRKTDDLQKIYGLSGKTFKRLEPYISIEQEKAKAPKKTEKLQVVDNAEDSPVDRKPPPPVTIKINQATVEEWQRLYGVGPAFANRIVKFRDALGGFFSIEQISEVYGLPDSTFESIKPQLIIEEKHKVILDLNTADLMSLKKHPYLRWKQANAIIKYREQHGAFVAVDDIRKIGAIDEGTFDKVAPYLTVVVDNEEEK
ncbi:MAG: helix-hairpin-helix domain-containing protein [Bacteroidota bacterium]